MIEPFAATGRQPAVRAGTDVLLRWGRVGRALELAHPRGPRTNAVDAWQAYAQALVRAGRADEAIGVLGPYLRHRRVPGALVEITEGQECDEHVLELPTPVAHEFRHAPKHCPDMWEVLPAQARILERSGHANEAIR
ncbi:hypothetical protein SRB5_00020 [Streptomyces sp. RB5]|uniref:Uncharacterized protein n=1 Tax=Streptomyces smaragdinus TaxID=2585196 RepID=A0A7K0C8U9_9ACTN|nr:hypothetical protein [Streptomyces smaragdinus]MQY09899.1 hypothetical protein [Streptomyces smaragdinus]